MTAGTGTRSRGNRDRAIEPEAKGTGPRTALPRVAGGGPYCLAANRARVPA
jgi:hypothetical protein